MRRFAVRRVAFGPDGGLIAANRSAQFQLGASFDALQHQASDALFGMRFGQLAAARAPGAMFRLTLSTGVRVLARCEFAEAHKTTVAVTPPAPAARVRTPDPDTITFATLDTGDARMAAVLERVAKIRGRDLPLLILGQTGTGRNGSPVRCTGIAACGRPFVAVNCAALPDSLIEAELFGYEDGAFTGARKRGSPARSCRPTAARCFSTKSATCRSRSRSG